MLEIIGQEHLKQTFKDMKELPPLTILLGPKGSGKTLFSKYVTQLYGYAYIIVNNKINDIRQMIDETVALDVPTVYYISVGVDRPTAFSNIATAMNARSNSTQ